MKTRRKALLAGVLAFFFAPSLEADVVSLKNGDRFTGQVKSLAGDKLVLGTEYADDISIDWSVISSFSSAEKVQVDLASGELVTGEIELTEEDRFQVITEKETLALNRADVKEFGPIPQPENYRFIDNWHGGLNFGLSVAKGNTDLSSLAISADPSRETSNDRISIFFSRVRSRDEGLPKADLYKVSGRYDRFLTENLFLYGAGTYDRDLESDLDYRFREGGGAGYRFKMADHTVLSALGGFSVAQEKFTLLGRSNDWLANTSVELKSTWLSPVVLTAGTTYSPFLTGPSRYLLETVVGVRIPLFGSLNFGLDFANDFDSDPPPPDVLRNDSRLLTTLGWTF